MIGDVEEISSSFSAGAIGLSSFGNTYQIYRPYYVNPTQIKNFKNRQIVDKGKGFTYTSYISGSDAVSVKGVSLGRQDGRAMSKTGFFATSSVGRIYYPSNHYINFQDGFVNNLWAGTQFQGGYYFRAFDLIKFMKLVEQEEGEVVGLCFEDNNVDIIIKADDK